MSTLDLLNTTSRAAMILGMTNTDQVGMQQALAPQRVSRPEGAEVLPDAGDANDPESAGGDVDEATGLSADELAEFEQMRTGAEPAGDPADPDADPDPVDGEGDPDGTDPAPEPAPARPLGQEKTPAELAAEAAAGKRPAAQPKHVSFGKYQRELKAAAEREANLVAAERKAREDSIKLAERVAIINEALSAPAPAPAPDPNAPPANPFDEEDIDPTVDYAESVKQIQRRQRFQNENAGRVEQEISDTREDREMKETFNRDFSAMAARPEYAALPQAYQFLKDSRLTEICISEFDKDPNDPAEQFTRAEVAKMVQIFNNEEKWVVGTAIKQGKSPSAAIMKLARARGFKPAASAAAPAPAARAPAAPAARVPAARPGAAPAPAAVPSAADQLADLAAAQAAGRSLSDGGGAPPTGLSAEMLLKMDDAEFAAMVDEMSQFQLDQIMGRTPG